MCARHIYANFRKTYKDKAWQKKFWLCAKSPCVNLFNYHWASLAKDTPEGANAIMRTDPQHWSRAWFKLGSLCDSVDNNMCESCNHAIVESRYLPISSMFEWIRREVMVRIHTNKSKAEKWTGVICPNILKKMKVYINESVFCHAVYNGQDGFEVTHRNHRLSVNLDSRTCSCRYWQLSGLPCPHAISCIYWRSSSLDDYIAPCYSIAEYNKTYDHCLQPVEGMTCWPTSERPRPRQPNFEKMPGRPKKARKREQNEKPKGTRMSKVGTIIRCRLCKGIGHNRSSCERRNGQAQQTSGPSQDQQGHCASVGNSAPTDPIPLVVIPGSQQSCTNMTKRKARSNSVNPPPPSKKSCTGVGVLYSERTDTTIQNPGMSNQRIIKTSATAKVSTQHGGSATMNLEASVASARAKSSVNIQVTFGSASGQAAAQAPAFQKKKLTPTKKKQSYSSKLAKLLGMPNNQ